MIAMTGNVRFREAIVTEIINLLKNIKEGKDNYTLTLIDEDITHQDDSAIENLEDGKCAVNVDDQKNIKIQDGGKKQVLKVLIEVGAVKGDIITNPYRQVNELLYNVLLCLTVNGLEYLQEKYGILTIIPVEDDVIKEKGDRERATGNVLFEITHSLGNHHVYLFDKYEVEIENS